jgi:hypothetical protein
VGTQRELNVIKVGDKEFLLTGGNGEAVHLTGAARSGDVGRTPFHDWRLDPKRAEGRVLRERYALAPLADPRWAETTLCGRQWISMETDWDEDSADDGGDVSSPTCRRCLALIDKLFPEPKLDNRFPLVVQLVTDTVLEYGTAEILEVPGDHQAALRREVRTAVRKRTGHGMETYAHESIVVFVCRPIYDQHADEHARAAAEAMNRVAAKLLSGEPVAALPSPMRLSWDAWATE